MILAILQARMSSSRLPGKILKPILGRPMLELQIERVKRCLRIDSLVVATSMREDDRAIVRLCDELGIHSYAGDLENVLDRFYQAAKIFHPDHIVRLTGDCPFFDPDQVDALIEFYLNEDCDYASNSRPPTLPDGLDAEIFRFKVLQQIWNETKDPYHLEHVTPFILSHPNRFKLSNYRYAKNYSHLRWTVDEPEDLDFVRSIYEALYPNNPNFNMDNVINLLTENPYLIQINAHHKGIRKYDNIASG